MEAQLSNGLAAGAVESDKVTAYGWKALAGSMIGYAMDGFDLLILGFMLPAISATLGLTSTQAGSLVTWTLIGAVAGGLIFGTMSDHFGRIRVMTWTILIFALFTGLCGSPKAIRTCSSIEPLPGLDSAASSALAWRWRPRHGRPASGGASRRTSALGWQAGVLLAALLTPLLLPVIGWRGMFLVGLLPAIVAFIVRKTLDEPEIFVKRVKSAEKKQNPFRLLVKDARTTRTSLGIVILCSVQNFGYYGMMIWMPTYLSTKLGFGLTRSAMWTSVTIIGMAFGIWAFGQLADRIGRKPSFLIFQIGAFVMVLIYSSSLIPFCCSGSVP